MQSYFSRLRLNVSSLKHVHTQKYLPMNQTLQNDDCWINCRVKKLKIYTSCVIGSDVGSRILIPERKRTQTKAK